MSASDMVRWLFRPFNEPAFLKLYIEEFESSRSVVGCGRRLFEDTFWSLKADREHPPDYRKVAWGRIEKWLENGDIYGQQAMATACCRALLNGLKNDLSTEEREARDVLAKFWLSPLFFMSPNGKKEKNIKEKKYVEIHAHLRGSLPFAELWKGWIKNQTLAAPLCTDKFTFTVGNWRCTYGEIVETAIKARKNFPVLPPNIVESENVLIAHIAEEILRPVGALSRWICAAIIYLSSFSVLRRKLLYQRSETGLAKFVDAYDMYSHTQKGPNRNRRTREIDNVGAILRRFEQDGATAVELRPTLDSSRSKLRRKLADIISAYFDYLLKSDQPVAMGLVMSLFKQEALKKDYDGADSATWDLQAEAWLQQIETLISIVEENPLLRYFVVGVDAAGQERGCPPRAFKDSFDLVRAYNSDHGLNHEIPGRRIDTYRLRKNLNDKIDELRRKGQYEGRDLDPPELFELLDEDWDCPEARLGMTFHVGEDFVDPMTGLRQIHEACTTFDLREGDRLGHCIAASLKKDELVRLLNRRGESPSEPDVEVVEKDRKWRIFKARGTHFLDLAWESEVANEADSRLIRSFLAELATRSFRVPAAIGQMAMDLRRNGPFVRLGLRGHRYKSPSDLDARDREWVELDEHWLERFENLRQKVVAELIVRGVTVESCPTSNVVVAGLSRPPIATFLAEPGLCCALATDDPGLFGAWPMDEFEFVKREVKDESLVERALRESRMAAFVHTLI